VVQAPGCVVACLLAALTLAGCASGFGRAGDVRQGGSIVVGVSRFPSSVDASSASEFEALQILSLVHTPLITYRPSDGKEGAELVPGLARDLPTVSGDGLSYTMTLRRGLRYSNGAPVEVADFARAVDRVRSLHSPLVRLYKPIRAITVDARSRTIRVDLNWRDPSFVNVLALPSSAPIPRDAPAVGVGPYRLAKVAEGRRAVLVRVRGFELPNVPGGHVDRITLSRAGPPAAIAQGVITGSLDVMEEPPPIDLLPEVRSKYRDRYREDPTSSSVVLIPNWRTPTLQDPAVRRAIGESLDRDRLVRLYVGLLQATCNVLPGTVPGYSAVDPCPYGDVHSPPNLVDAERQIETAGASGALLTVRAGSGVPGAVARDVMRTVRKIGLRATLSEDRRASLRLERIAPLIPHASAFLDRFVSAHDPGVADAVAQATASDQQDGTADSAWSAADDRVVSEAIAVPLGVELRPTFLSERLDAANCERVHPLLGLDLSSLCLK
jgi:peptide/nickel transport system substrate-binding protein